MSSDGTLRKIGAKKATEPMTMSALLSFAEKIIQTDKDSIMRAQNALSDLTAHSNDTSMPPKISALQQLCGKSGVVRIQSPQNDETKAEKLVELNSLRRKS